MTQTYSNWFYTEFHEHTMESARVIVPLVIDLIHPKSVVDVGCGVGAFLSVFIQHGVEDILGLDGDWVDLNMLMVPRDKFDIVDLERPEPPDRSFDLVVCLEVAEHLPPELASSFIDWLTGLGPAVLFSAAIPYQGGEHHRNEQWPDYWAERFEQRGFLTIDCIRREIWDDDRVLFWYSQNTLLFVHRELLSASPSLQKELERTNRLMLSVVHPKKYMPIAKVFYGALRCIPPPLRRLAVKIFGKRLRV